MSIRRLRRLTAEIDEQHRQSMTTIDDELGERHFGTDPALAASRRQFLTRAAAGGAIAFGATAVPVAAMVPAALAQTPGSTPSSSTAGGSSSSGSSGGTAVTPAGSTPPGPAATTGAKPKVEGNDLTIVQFMQTIELAAVAAYQSIVDSGRLSSTVAVSARQFALHHQDHAHKFAEYAGGSAPNLANARLVREIETQVAAASVDGDRAERLLAQVAYDLETGIAATHAFALGELDGWEIASVSSIIVPVEAQHALAWSLVVDPDIASWQTAITSWIPSFQNDTEAFSANEYAAS